MIGENICSRKTADGMQQRSGFHGGLKMGTRISDKRGRPTDLRINRKNDSWIRIEELVEDAMTSGGYWCSSYAVDKAAFVVAGVNHGRNR